MKHTVRHESPLSERLDNDLLAYLKKIKRPKETISAVLRRELAIPPSKPRRNDRAAKTKRAAPKFLSSALKQRALLRYIDKSSFDGIKTAKERYLALLATLYRLDESGFKRVLQISRGNRGYFGISSSDDRLKGSRSGPDPIFGSPFWALTNMNHPRKRDIIKQVLIRLNYPSKIAERVSNAI